METTTESIDTYRRAGRAIGREQGCTAAGVIFAGVCAEYMYRSQIGATGMDNPAETLIEVLCGDALGIRAGDELGIVASVRITNWVSVNWSIIEERAQLLGDTPAADTAEESAYRTVATQMALSVADEHHVAVSVVAGAAAVARLRRHTSSDVEGSTEDQIAEMAQTDPALAAAWDELDETVRRGPGSWVIHRWGDICAAAEELASLTTAADTPPTVEQQVAIARHEVANWLRQTKLPACGTAYAAAAAEGRVRWLAAGGADEDEDAVMAGFAAGDPAAVEAHTAFTPEARELIRRRVRELWG
ncbi:Uncharacterised protein [Mycobacteroides abscessus subsp. massiliense]|uniref:hypothetical protein n=1 Tax=Mycobacteroides abscessus TaxID=36809 RepID=UPI0009A8AD9E|nr:hypothetical protein [Mycobacteroides abscessus]SLG53524.1 Uncharacterised protein [Mycobacteroides abscessus subsp. massiliense]SLH95538.1 Uncharacterised protein [Mycobacteroides abscessus subsp. massiliense]